jgi:hypothetical protein
MMNRLLKTILFAGMLAAAVCCGSRISGSFVSVRDGMFVRDGLR